MTPPASHPRSFATMLALWAIAIAAMVLVTLQSSAWRQAAAGREDLARVRAKWAARAGIEACIAVLADDTVHPDDTNAFRTRDAFENVATGELAQSSYSIYHTEYPNEVDGPEDAHAKININLMTREDLLTFIDMTEDVADSILDWIDEDDDVRALGAESGYYLRSKGFRYTARNAPMRTLQELELVAGVDPLRVRGEDWNLNSKLDPSENDGDASWPPDNTDGKLDAGWSEHLTTYSVDGGMALSGKARLDLRVANASEIQQRVTDLDKDQADAISAYGAGLTSTMAAFLTSDLSALARQAGASNSARQARALTDDQLRSLFNECMLEDSTTTQKHLGKLNINTCSKETLEHLSGIDSALADVIILERDARAQGFSSIVDLLSVPAITRARLAQLYPLLTTRSNVYVVHCKGRDGPTGLEVEITAVLDRSSLPIAIKDYVVH